jgi:hypothetical protein
MKKDKLLRALIKEILLNEDDVGGDPGPPDSAYGDAPKLDSHGNVSYHASASSSHGYGGGGPFGGQGVFSSALSKFGNDVVNAGKEVGGAVLKSAAQLAGISFLANNPWSASFMGDSWVQNYLNTMEKGTTKDIALKTLTAHLYKKYNIPAAVGIIKFSGIPLMISGAGYLANRLASDHGVSPILRSLSQNIESISKQLPNMPEDVKSMFSVDKNEHEAMKNFLYTQIQDVKRGKKSNSPISSNIRQAVQSAKEFIIENPELSDKNNLNKFLIEKGFDKNSSQQFSNLILYLNKE